MATYNMAVAGTAPLYAAQYFNVRVLGDGIVWTDQDQADLLAYLQSKGKMQGTVSVNYQPEMTPITLP